MRAPTWGAIAAAIVLGVLTAATAATAAPSRSSDTARPWKTGGWQPGMMPARGAATRGATGVTDLPARSDDLELVSKLELNGEFGDVVDGQIADVAVYKNTAYLNSWDEPTCTRGGTYVVDISDPANPKETGFIPSPAGYYSGEGAHVISVKTPQFTGDILAVNLEACSYAPGPDDTTRGGFSLYDVTDPKNPKPLAVQVGDRTPDGSLELGPNPPALPNSYHSVFLWQDGPRAYLVGVDNVEFADVDIYDITDPAAPELITDLDLYDAFPDVYDADAPTLNDEVFHHDMVVKHIGGKPVMLVSYWDAGYVKLDVSNPANPQYLADSDFAGPDLLGFTPQEGNGHQGEFSHDNRFVLAADEDFAPFRIDTLTIASGPNAGDVPASAIGGGAPPSVLDDGEINGPTVYAGYACDGSKPIPTFASTGLTLEPGEEAIAVVQRGPTGDANNPESACFPGEKAANAVEAGYDAVVFVNRHFGSAAADEAYCGSGGYPSGAVIPSVCTTHEALHRIFNKMPPDFSLPYDPTKEPALGDVGEDVSVTGTFDGWGYARLLDGDTLAERDAYAIPESQISALSAGYGDLSIHEFATDPTENLAYSAYYAGGMRVVRFGDGGMEEAGAYIDDRGANYWGVEQFTHNGQRLIAGSDRDYGLYILRYTGPDAAQPPACQARTASTTLNTAVQIPLVCTDANGNPLTLRVASEPSHGVVSVNGTTATYTPRPGFTGTDGFTYLANDGAADSIASPVTITVQTPAQSGTPPQPNRPGQVQAAGRVLGTTPGKLAKSRRSMKVRVRVSGPGRIVVRLRARLGRRIVTLGSGSRQARRAGTYTVTVRMSRSRARSLARAIRRSSRDRIGGTLRITFDPAGTPRPRTSNRAVTLR